jgi:MoCo/4Fe-4S cofactor protein with predicted Tat translocation signal
MAVNSDNGRYWKSLNQLNGEPAFVESTKKEFKEGVTNEINLDEMPEMSRRKFLAVMGATAAVTMTGCSDYPDKGKVVSYNKAPEEVMYGRANHYASTLNDGQGILVKAREGRPVKIDGNPEHPINKGKVDATAQAQILDLFDPGRLQFPIQKSDSDLLLYRDDMPRSEWEKLDSKIVEALKKAESEGKEIAVITNSVISPTQNKLFNDFTAKYPSARIYSYELIDSRHERQAWKEAFGIDGVPAPKIDEADVILSLDCDFLATEGRTAENIRKFSSRRNVDDAENFNKLIQIEGFLSTTGMNADVRLRLEPAAQYEFAMALANEFAGSAAEGFTPEQVAEISKYNLNSVAKKYHLKEEKLKELVDSVRKAKGKTLVMAGQKFPAEVHKAVILLNEILGSRGLFDFARTTKLQRPLNSFTDMKNLAGKMNAGKVGAVIHFDSNPVYQLPPEINYKQAMAKVPLKITLSPTRHESSRDNDYIIPINHDLESWNDFEIVDGIYSFQQPIIAPIWDTRQKEAILLNWMSDENTVYSDAIYHDYMKANWQENFYPGLNLGAGFEQFWISCIHDGFYEKKPANAELVLLPFAIGANSKMKSSGFTVILNRGTFIKDGKFANNGWLQETPHPVTKVVWDNYAAMSPHTAKELGVSYGLDATDKKADMVDIDIKGRKISLPVMIQPGMADNVIYTELGYGREMAGEVGNSVGADTIALMSISDGITEYLYTGASVTKAETTMELITTQEHHSLDDEFVKDFHRSRHIINEYTVDFYKEFEKKYKEAKKELAGKYGKDTKEYKEHLEEEKYHLLGKHKYDLKSMYPDKEYKEVKWAMAIDQNKCTACGACVTACNVENNIPVVGKDQTSRGREMHWMRIDTYFSGTPDEPVVSTQPMLCQHCDNAPCENVCPVVATTHSPDGLNQMVYNRCVGTRYCANNCPYKVRRFNFFDFRYWFADAYYQGKSLEAMHNPEVTVRERGVMEKCTFCVQRISEARSEAKRLGRDVKGSDVKTACQEACPAEAITFGDMLDPESDVAQKREHPLGYHVLDTLNVRPNVTYVSKLRNTNTEVMHSEHHH